MSLVPNMEEASSEGKFRIELRRGRFGKKWYSDLHLLHTSRVRP